MSGEEAAFAAARTAAEGIRLLNHATIHRRLSPSGVYDVLGQLSAMASRLPQTLGQMERDVREQRDEGLLVRDRGLPVAESVAALELAMADALSGVYALHDGLSRAQSAISDMAPAEEEET